MMQTYLVDERPARRWFVGLSRWQGHPRGVYMRFGRRVVLAMKLPRWRHLGGDVYGGRCCGKHI